MQKGYPGGESGIGNQKAAFRKRNRGTQNLTYKWADFLISVCRFLVAFKNRMPHKEAFI